MYRRVEGTEVETTAPTSAASTPAPPRPSSTPRRPDVSGQRSWPITDCGFWVIDGRRVRRRGSAKWFPMAMHMLEGMLIGMRSSQRIVGQRERLLSLGACPPV